MRPDRTMNPFKGMKNTEHGNDMEMYIFFVLLIFI